MRGKIKVLLSLVIVGLGFLIGGARVTRAACPDINGCLCTSATRWFNCIFNHNCDGCIDWPLPDCAGSTSCACRTTGNECGAGGEPVCEGASGGWNYKFGAQCVRGKPNEFTGECSAYWHWQYRNCSASDRCQDSSVGNNAGSCDSGGYQSGSNSSGQILAGQCSAAMCSSTGCSNGGWYKTCCKYRDLDGSGGPSTGDELTGSRSNCSNCQGTDCCTSSVGRVANPQASS
jgi:hypothetical protein